MPSHAPPASAYLAPTTGEVLLYDAMGLEAVNVVEAHRSPVSCMAMNGQGTLLATASDKGTIIRVFSVPHAEKLYQFRRGSIPSSIYHMSFNLSSTLLCVSSASETVHVFRLDLPSPPSSEKTSTDLWRRLASESPTSTSPPSSRDGRDEKDGQLAARTHHGTLGSIIRLSSQTVGKTFASSVGGYLPSAVTEMWKPTRDFAFVKIPREPGGASTSSSSSSSAIANGGRPVKSVVAMSSSQPQLMIVTSQGHFYVFGLDMEKGGEGFLMKQLSYVISPSGHPHQHSRRY